MASSAAIQAEIDKLTGKREKLQTCIHNLHGAADTLSSIRNPYQPESGSWQGQKEKEFVEFLEHGIQHTKQEINNKVQENLGTMQAKIGTYNSQIATKEVELKAAKAAEAAQAAAEAQKAREAAEKEKNGPR